MGSWSRQRDGARVPLAKIARETITGILESMAEKAMSTFGSWHGGEGDHSIPPRDSEIDNALLPLVLYLHNKVRDAKDPKDRLLVYTGI